MRKGILIVALLLLGVGLFIQSCKKEDRNIDLTASTWKIKEVIWSGQSSPISTDSVYVLEFVNDTQLTLGLDVNTCFGKYYLTGNGIIQIEGMGCTEMCCDSEFAINLSLLLPKMTEYFGMGEELHFEGDGKIILIKN